MLTFELIRDMERGEREEKTLQKLPGNFMEEVREYITKKQGIQEKSSQDIEELATVKRSLKMLFEARERKILEQAIYTVKTGLPVENLTKDEERIYLYIIEELKKHREKFFQEANEPLKIQEKSTEAIEEPKKEENPITPLKEEKIQYKVIKSLPEFVGPDLETYKLKESQILEKGQLPKTLNDLLLKKGVLELVK